MGETCSILLQSEVSQRNRGFCLSTFFSLLSRAHRLKLACLNNLQLCVQDRVVEILSVPLQNPFPDGRSPTNIMDCQITPTNSAKYNPTSAQVRTRICLRKE